VDPVASLLGPDVLLWNSVFICKEPGVAEIPWHQDRDYLLLEPCINATVWLAIDDATAENGCLQVVPRSHGTYLPHTPRQHRHEFDARADIPDSVKQRAVKVELRAGQFILFHKQLLHYSGSNRSKGRRLGLAIRYTVPGVKVNTGSFFEGYRVYPVRGADPVGANPIGAPPRD
jgi:ectoine hydroxylase-related dioxygenase (phytanoyl-CoA dioxygenase family)